MNNINFDSIESLKNEFKGFVSIATLKKQNNAPRVQGIYLIVRKDTSAPTFVEIGTGGHFKEQDPNVAIQELKNNWIENSVVLYIGKAGGIDANGKQSAATLQKRLEQYMQFGSGKKVGHKGGRYIWQLKDAEELLVCWKEMPKENPIKEESLLIENFKNSHNGRRPFANLRD